MVKSGQFYLTINTLVSSLDLDDRISFLGSMPPSKVRAHMEKANIFLFTSDRQEGWGAVLNESMNSGCAVVASQAIGSVPFLVKHGENGFIYKDNEINDLYNKIEILLKNSNLRGKLGRNAVRTMEGMWSPKVASERLVQLCEGLMMGEIVDFTEGPCSKAYEF